jgi:hypothetical protein
MKTTCKKINQPMLFVTILIAVSWLGTGCKYYKVNTAENVEAVQTHITKNTKYFILHQGASVWHIKDLTLDNENQLLQGILEPLPEEHYYYHHTKPDKPNRFKNNYKGDRSRPTDEIHFYIAEYAEGPGELITIPFSAIEKIEVYDNDSGANAASAVFATLGIVAGTFAVLVAIVAATKSSCPFVYVNDGNVYRFIGEMYGGAILPSLERHDYMPLPKRYAEDSLYQLMIANKLLERQYTNIAELIVVDHPIGSAVVLDQDGNVQTFNQLQSPAYARGASEVDYTHAIIDRDSISYLFNDHDKKKKELSELELTFTRPMHATHGKLILHAKNSYWLDYIYGKFNEQFGSYFDEHMANLKKEPAQKHLQWSLDQGIPLSVYLETRDGWTFVDYFTVIGPLASRDLVMAIDLSAVSGAAVKIKLECGFMFWEVDYAAIDFEQNIPTGITYLDPTTAIDEMGKETAHLLAAEDDQYLFQPDIGNEATLTYIIPEVVTGMQQSFFLHSKGYYEYIRDYQGVPDILYLNNFKKPGRFTQYSRETYNSMFDNQYYF